MIIDYKISDIKDAGIFLLIYLYTLLDKSQNDQPVQEPVGYTNTNEGK